MNFFKKKYVLRRYSTPQNMNGYITTPFADQLLLMDIQTVEAIVKPDTDGLETVQKLKVFCDFEIFVENDELQKKADRIWFQNKWFICISSRLSENTPLRHWTSMFIECQDKEEAPGGILL